MEKTKARKFLTQQQIIEELQISRGTLYRWLRAGSFPQGIRVGDRAIRWEAQAIEDWLATRKAQVEGKDGAS